MKKIVIEIDTNWDNDQLIFMIKDSLDKGNVFGEIKNIKILDEVIN